MKLQKILRVCGLFALLALGALHFPTTNVYAAPTFTIPTAPFLNMDGTLNLTTGAQGSLNLKEWNVSLDPQRGPVLTANAPNVPGWSAVTNGVKGKISSIAFMGTDVYIGGNFTEICGNATCDSGNLPIKYIAKWNGSSWSALGFGVDEPVSVLAVNGSDLYVGGAFVWVCLNSACNVVTTVNHIAKWDGSNWSGLKRGVGDSDDRWRYSVSTIVVVGSDVYVGGYFRYACGSIGCSIDNIRVNNVAKWNGTSWSALDFGLKGSTSAIAVSGNDLYIGGSFEYRCGDETCASGNVKMNNIAKWSLASSSWSSLGYGLSSSVYALKVSGNELYAGGGFTKICGNETCDSGNVIANRIAKWNGANWAALGNGIDGLVFDIEVSGSDVYAGGDFYFLCNDATCDYSTAIADNVAKWNGATWAPLGLGVGGRGEPDTVLELAVREGEIYVVGDFPRVCGNYLCNRQDSMQVNSMAKYNPSGACPTKPGKPSLWLPENNRTVRSRPTFYWWSAMCAVTYNLIVKDAATSKTVVKVKGLDTSLMQYKLVKALPKGKSYIWFVEALNSFGKTKSETRTFTVK